MLSLAAKTRKSKTSLSNVSESGWSAALLRGGEQTGCNGRREIDLFLAEVGVVTREDSERDESPTEWPSKEGTDSVDRVLVDRYDSVPGSLAKVSSSTSSSGGLSRTSIGDLPIDMS